MEKKTLIDPMELSMLMKTEPVVVIDTRDPEQYAISHIPGAVNIREIFSYLSTSTSEGLLSMQDMFAKLLGDAGLSGKELAVIYEDAMNNGYGQSCRGYFLLKYLGYPSVSILHGGYKAWQDAGLPTTTEVPTPEKKTFPLNVDSSILIDKQEMLKALSNPSIIKLDVRDFDEWMGESSSPYGVDFCPRKGRIPGAVLIEWYSMMKQASMVPMFKSKEEMLAIANEVGIKPDSMVYIYCFKGARASNTLVALKEAGIENAKIYFASWNEWSRDPSLPIEEGAPDPKRPAVRALVQA
ncbi:MAG: sulfurtransferase [Chloroflexi bacterium]|nr:sulfurtransferase [Ktedonobacteraceae bacterium]MBV9706154.1 sulfurtransferase [Chloroflexota bacterium]